MKAIHRKRLTAVGAFIGVGLVVGALLGGAINQIEGGRLAPHLIRAATAGTLIGLLIGSGEEFLFAGVGRSLGYIALNVSRILLYSLVVFASVVGANAAYPWLLGDTSILEGAAAYLGLDTVARDLVLAVLAAVLGTSMLEVRRLHNPGDLRRFLMGKYRRPQEERRVFLLADLEDSTGLAERLGDLTYSRLLSDCYYDMAEAILAWRGQVYQYVGDQIIVTWPFAQGVSDARCVRCFFDMAALLEAKRSRNEARYGVAPRFRASIHGGSVITTWVGEAKKELAFHGDALNAVARAQKLCRRLDSACLVSSTVLESLDLPSDLRAVPKGAYELRGRNEPLEVWSIERQP